MYAGDPGDLKFVKSFARPSHADAVLCANDHTAAQLLQSLSRLGFRVPADLAVAGFDNVHFAGLLTTPLTTMEQSCRDLALTAFQAMKARLANPTLPPKALLLVPRLVVRESCGRARPQ